MVLWRKVMQTARLTMGTVALTFCKPLVLVILEGVTLSCKTTFWRRELLLGGAVQMQSSGTRHSPRYCMGRPAGEQRLKLILCGCLLGSSSFPCLPFGLRWEAENRVIAWICPVWLSPFKIRWWSYNKWLMVQWGQMEGEVWSTEKRDEKAGQR